MRSHSCLNVFISSGHSPRNTSAPVNEPSPPQTTNASIPSLIRLNAAANLPSLVLNSLDLAVPIKVPPCKLSKRSQCICGSRSISRSDVFRREGYEVQSDQHGIIMATSLSYTWSFASMSSRLNKRLTSANQPLTSSQPTLTMYLPLSDLPPKTTESPVPSFNNSPSSNLKLCNIPESVLSDRGLCRSLAPTFPRTRPS